MDIWSRVSQLMWREARMPPEAPAPPPPREGAGAPDFLRKAVRFALTGTAATLLTAQVIGIRLTAPVDASDPYQDCIKSCRDDRKTCNDACQDQHKAAIALCGDTHTACLRACAGFPNPAPGCRQACSSAHNTCVLAANDAKHTCNQACDAGFTNCALVRCGVRLPPNAH